MVWIYGIQKLINVVEEPEENFTIFNSVFTISQINKKCKIMLEQEIYVLRLCLWSHSPATKINNILDILARTHECPFFEQKKNKK